MSFDLEKAWLQVKDIAGDIAAATSETDKAQYNAALEVWKKAMTYLEEKEEERDFEKEGKRSELAGEAKTVPTFP